MATLIIGGHLIGNFVGTPAEWFGHYFLLLSADGTPSGGDQIIRAGQDNEKIILQYGIDYAASADDPTFWGQAAGVSNPDDYYGYAALDVGDRNPFAIWNTLIDLASQIHQHQIDYDRPNQNSNSVVATLLQAVGIEIINPPLPDASHYSYPGEERILTSDWLFNSYYSYVVRGNDLDANNNPINDVLHALTGTELFVNGNGDYVVGFAGDDLIYDGNRNDILEGGEGNDTYMLSDDGEADTIIVGTGDDVIVGGDSEDRIVIRGSALGGSETKGLALLGGFGGGDWGTAYQARFWLEAIGTQTWEEWKTITGMTDEEKGDIQDEWNITVALQDWPFLNEFGNEYLYLNDIGYYLNGHELKIVYKLLDESTSTWTEGTITIQNFVEGDFGIQFFDVTKVENLTLQLGGTYFTYISDDPAGFEHIWNSGDLVNLPSAPNRWTMEGTDGDDSMQGTPGDDTMYAKGGNDTVNAGDGDDTIIGGTGAGNDAYDGGNGTDKLVYSSAVAPIVVDLELGTASGIDIDSDTITNIENVIGGAGADTISGNAEDNLFAGGAGNDIIDGKGGIDRAFYNGLRADYTLAVDSQGIVSVAIGSETDQLTNVEFLVFADETVDVADLTESPSDDPWIASDDRFWTAFETPVVVDIAANDAIPSGSNFSAFIWTQPEHGTVYWNGTGYTYEPDEGFTGVDWFYYGLHDGDNDNEAMSEAAVALVHVGQTYDPDNHTGVTGGVGTGNDNYFGGTSFNDTANFTGGDEAYADGGAGDDIIIFDDDIANYEIQGQGEHFIITNTVTGDGIQFTNMEYIRFNGTAALSLADIVANSNYDPGDTWFEPEPIGGLV